MFYYTYNIHIVYFDHIHSSNSLQIYPTSLLTLLVFFLSPSLFKNLSIEFVLFQ